MKFLKLFLILLVSMLFTACSPQRFSDGTSPWSDGMVIIFGLLLGGSIAFAIWAYRICQKGSYTGGSNGVPLEESSTKYPFYKHSLFKYFAIPLFILAIGFYIYVSYFYV